MVLQAGRRWQMEKRPAAAKGALRMIDAANYDRHAALKNGVKVKIRSVRPDDKKRFGDAFKKLDPETIYSRFFHHKKTLTDAELKSATELDFETVVALVVTIGEGEHEVIIGAGRFVVIDKSSPSAGAEVAFTVEEDYHRQGLARMLLQHLALIAREKGLSRFVAEVLPENRGMLTVFSRSGLPMESVHGGEAVHVTLSLAGESPSSSPNV
jgi:GNAT superfamily N-acetyltransferase